MKYFNDCDNEDTPRLILFERGERPEPGGLYEGNHLAQEIDAAYDRMMAKHKCYMPKVPLGGCIVFDRDIVHGSYRRSTMTKIRYGFDFRALGIFKMPRDRRMIVGSLYERKDIRSYRLSEIMRFGAPAELNKISRLVRPS